MAKKTKKKDATEKMREEMAQEATDLAERLRHRGIDAGLSLKAAAALVAEIMQNEADDAAQVVEVEAEAEGD